MDGIDLLSLSGYLLITPFTPCNSFMVEWNEMHLEGRTPWNLGEPCAALKWFFTSCPVGQEITPQLKRILVPGCGQWYDCQWLAQFKEDWQVIGVDISEVAIKNCQNQFSAVNVQFQLLDFFAPSEELKGFDLVFDYTFFCAIEPSMRSEWGARMASVIGKGKYLLCLMYPLDQEDPSKGPPFGVSEEAYCGALEKDFKLIWRSGREVLPGNEQRLDRHLKQELALFQKQ